MKCNDRLFYEVNLYIKRNKNNKINKIKNRNANKYINITLNYATIYIHIHQYTNT